MSALKPCKYVAYYRVSTDRQGKSGLGLDAQRSAVLAHVNGDAELVAEHTEIETGRRNDRPELAKALEACRRNKATLLIAKLDRLSRNLAFIATLMDSGTDFVAVDSPNATRLTLHILAAVAEHEREMISARTAAALQAARARGVRLGNPRPVEASQRATAALKVAAGQFAGNVLPIIRELQASGISSRAGLAAALNARKVPTARGGSWSHVQVGAILARA
jgi:DNA invertase Pin-like site-specific DNA recombinase